ncbi:DUF4188 domain-containing protein [Bacillus sp. TH22]|uniref:DUF4188 domain-containing protein n=5 Tax=Bacillus cereus group TaxID=86661 RepID=A0A0B5RWB8_BACMY|nr:MULTISPECIES: DUF4188 domain-containing protein [Bacillus]EJS05880.1 hypothetical protein IKO_02536 [Bacillus cereus VDM034]EJS14343.1 hypothetical protein IKS_02577 [Bacillus cereus VDM062]MBT2576251.1 DUF4188 domain-containing protein [Bacillus sp. ISL-8]ABY44154.1 conserved hypothetical protein [Bacillus mycoides KBAB4]AJH17351.1 hypothetical protein BG05_2837 [Bacillus mycoides]
MGAKIFNGRHIANSKDQEFVVFIIGMRINNLLKFWKWIPVFNAMGPMIKELYQNPQWGFLHTEFLFSWRKVILIQYWKGFDELVNYAHGKNHSYAWKSYNNKIKDNGSVGVFHETYQIEKGASEAIYVNMPKTGLSRATEHIPVSQDTNTAQKRMNK